MKEKEFCTSVLRVFVRFTWRERSVVGNTLFLFVFFVYYSPVMMNCITRTNYSGISFILLSFSCIVAQSLVLSTLEYITNGGLGFLMCVHGRQRKRKKGGGEGRKGWLFFFLLSVLESLCLSTYFPRHGGIFNRYMPP